MLHAIVGGRCIYIRGLKACKGCACVAVMVLHHYIIPATACAPTCCRHPAGILLVREDCMHGPGSAGYAVLATAYNACIAMDALQYSVRVAVS